MIKNILFYILILECIYILGIKCAIGTKNLAIAYEKKKKVKEYEKCLNTIKEYDANRYYDVLD